MLKEVDVSELVVVRYSYKDTQFDVIDKFENYCVFPRSLSESDIEKELQEFSVSINCVLLDYEIVSSHPISFL